MILGINAEQNFRSLRQQHAHLRHVAVLLIRVTKHRQQLQVTKKGKGSPCSITERRVPELIPVLGSQPAGAVSHKPGGRLPLLSVRPAVTPQPLRGLLPILLLGGQRHNGCEQFA